MAPNPVSVYLSGRSARVHLYGNEDVSLLRTLINNTHTQGEEAVRVRYKLVLLIVISSVSNNNNKNYTNPR